MIEYLSKRIKTPFQYKVITALDIRTKYLVAGQGTPVVLVHGAGAGAIAWFPLIDALSGEFSIIAPDVVGYGESDKPSASYSRYFFSSWLQAFCDTLGINQFVLVGHSMGGAVSLHFAMDNPDRVSQLVLISPAGIGWSFPIPGLIYAIWFHCFPSIATSRKLLTHLVYHRNNLDDHFVRYARDVCQTPGGSRVVWQGLGRFAIPLQHKQLEGIRQPTLVIWGEDDRIIPPSHGLRAVRTMPNAQLQLVPRAGHIPFFDEPELVSQLILRFLLTSK